MRGVEVTDGGYAIYLCLNGDSLATFGEIDLVLNAERARTGGAKGESIKIS